MNLAYDIEPYFYAERGWTNPILKLLNPRLWFPFTTADNRVIRDYVRFMGLNSDDATQLIDLIPKDALGDRQNNGPTLQTLLEACKASEGLIELSGYIITDKRFDERITVDGLMIFDPHLCDQSATLSRQDVWEYVIKDLHIADAFAPPDEIDFTFAQDDETKKGWWLWWD